MLETVSFARFGCLSHSLWLHLTLHFNRQVECTGRKRRAEAEKGKRRGKGVSASLHANVDFSVVEVLRRSEFAGLISKF